MAESYASALARGRAIGARRADDPALMALFCQNDIQYAVGAVSPELVWEGAQLKGLTTRDLVALCARDVMAVSELQWL